MTKRATGLQCDASACAAVLGVLAVTVLGACTTAHDVDAPLAGSSAALGGAELSIPKDCAELIRPGIAPRDLRCTGLYSDVEEKKVGPGIREFAPAIPFWSDGADKQRWIHLPRGKKIDTSDMNRWELPVGTRLFKEFKWKGRRVETRLYYKESETRWLKASYKWNDDETAAERFIGGEFMVDGDPYYIPSAEECDQCHKGGSDRALGFEALMLGLEGAEGITLDMLIEEGLLSDVDDIPDNIEIGDDGTGRAAEALGWLHSNCGMSCHNGDSGSEAYRTGLRLSIDVTEADGRDPSGYDAYETLINEDATVDRWLGETRLVPGNPEDSLLYQLISVRVPENPATAMPPLATMVVDTKGVAKVTRWIQALDDADGSNNPQ